MKKRILSVLLLAALFIAESACALAAPDINVKECAYSLLNTDESRLLQLGILQSVAKDEFLRKGYTADEFPSFDSSEVTFCGSLSEAQTILSAGTSDSIVVYRSVAEALCVLDDTLSLPAVTWDQDDSALVQNVLKPVMCDDFMFQLSSAQGDLKDQINTALEEIKADGTMQQLTEDWIVHFDPAATVNLDSDAPPLSLAVTGDLPPFDYTAADGSPSGFNLALLTEIGSRIGRSVKPVSVLAVNRQYAVTHNVADLAFWAMPAAASLKEVELKDSLPELSQKESETVFAIQDLIRQGYTDIQLPAGTATTEPFYSDYAVPLMTAALREKIECIRAGKPVPGLPVIISNPISLTVWEGGSCTFMSEYSDATFAEWHFVSPSGRVDVDYSNMQAAYPGTQISNGMFKDMTLDYVTKDFNGGKVYCRFRNNNGYMDTNWALITVVDPGTWLPLEEQKQTSPMITVYDEYGGSAAIYQTQMGWYDTNGRTFTQTAAGEYRSSAGTVYYTTAPSP